MILSGVYIRSHQERHVYHVERDIKKARHLYS